MKLQYEPLRQDQLTTNLHVRDLSTPDRHEARRNLFIATKLANKALAKVDLGIKLD